MRTAVTLTSYFWSLPCDARIRAQSYPDCIGLAWPGPVVLQRMFEFWWWVSLQSLHLCSEDFVAAGSFNLDRPTGWRF